MTCPKCQTSRPLSPRGPIVADSQWQWCTECWTPVLVRISDGTIVRVGKP